MNKKRLVWLDMAKGIGILLVIYCHTCREFTVINQWICSFFMPMFFISGGYTYKHKKNFLLANIKRILLPYYFWGFAGVFFTLASGIADGTLKNLNFVDYFLDLILGVSMENYPLWFLCAFFVTKTLFDIIQHSIEMLKKHGETVCLFLEMFAVVAITVLGFVISMQKISGFTVFRADTGMIMLPFFYIGKYISVWNKKVDLSVPAVAIGAAVLLVLNIITGVYWNGLVSVNSNEYGNVLAFYISSITGSLFVFAFCILLEKVKYISEFVAWFGKNSMEIMCTHALVLRVLAVCFIYILKFSVPPIISTLICGLLEIPVVFLLCKIKTIIEKYLLKSKESI